jgi:hypothetical protein
MRRPWLAGLLSLIGAPIGHVYCGRPQRAVAFWLAGMLVFPIVAFCWVTFHRIIVDKIWTRANSLKRSDVVVYQSVQDPSQLHVMRVLALPGETIRFEGAKTFVGDNEINVPEAHTDSLTPPGFVSAQLSKSKEIVIEPDSFFVVGDNRNLSYEP